MPLFKSKKNVSFESECVEPTDGEFFERYWLYHNSSWFLIIFLLACLPIYLSELLEVAITASTDVEMTCLVPQLIHRMHWNMSAIRNLSMPREGRVCTYYDLDYSVYNNMDPEEALEIRRNTSVPIRRCTIKITSGDYSFTKHSKTFLCSCVGFEFKEKAKNRRIIAAGISFIVSGILADLYGRKPVFIISSVIYFLGILLTPNVKTYYTLIAASSIAAFGNGGLLLTNYIWILELCHKSHRGLFMIYIHMSGAIGKITGYILKSYILDCQRIYYLYSLPAIGLILYMYIIPESSRWCLSYGKKKRAWKMLHSWGENIEDRVFLPEVAVSKFQLLMDNFRILFGYKKNKRTVIIMAWAKFVKNMVIKNIRRYVKIRDLSAMSHKFLMFLAEMFSFLMVLPPFIFFGRYLAQYYLIICGALCLFLSFFVYTGTGYWYVLNLLSAQYFFGLEWIIYLYSAELLPTGARATGFGIIVGVSEILTFIGRYVLKIITSRLTVDYLENLVFFSLQISCICLMTLLPNMRIVELPDWKRYRNAIPM